MCLCGGKSFSPSFPSFSSSLPWSLPRSLSQPPPPSHSLLSSSTSFLALLSALISNPVQIFAAIDLLRHALQRRQRLPRGRRLVGFHAHQYPLGRHLPFQGPFQFPSNSSPSPSSFPSCSSSSSSSQTMTAAGAIKTLRIALAAISTHPIAQLMIVAYSVVFIVEGASGFGTPAAIAGPLLGHTPHSSSSPPPLPI